MLIEINLQDDEFMAELNLLGRVFLSNILKDSLKTRLLINETIQQIPDVLKVCICGSKGAPGMRAPVWVQNVSFSCSFWRKLAKIVG